MIFYFTATGNSLYVAKQFEEKPISIPQALRRNDLHFEDTVIGIVTPDYAGELPKIVREFLRRASFKADYIYMLITYGMADSVSGEWGKAFAKENGIDIDYVQTIKMVDNYLPVFDMDEQKAMDKQVEEQIAAAKEAVKNRATGCPIPTEDGREKYEMVAQRNREHPEINNGSQITVTDACISCGICAKVCPIGRFYVEDGKARRRENTCEFCLACAHACPQKAIIMGIGEQNPNARYRNEHVSLQEIIAANNQNN